MQELGIGGFFKDGDEREMDSRCVHELLACFVGTGEISEHDTGAYLQLELRTQQPSSKCACEWRYHRTGLFEFC